MLQWLWPSCEIFRICIETDFDLMPEYFSEKSYSITVLFRWRPKLTQTNSAFACVYVSYAFDAIAGETIVATISAAAAAVARFSFSAMYRRNKSKLIQLRRNWTHLPMSINKWCVRKMAASFAVQCSSFHVILFLSIIFGLFYVIRST